LRRHGSANRRDGSSRSEQSRYGFLMSSLSLSLSLSLLCLIAAYGSSVGYLPCSCSRSEAVKMRTAIVTGLSSSAGAVRALRLARLVGDRRGRALQCNGCLARY
jgi:hypothetical protein